MKKLLKYVDRRIVGMLLVTIVVFVGLNLTWVSSASKKLDENRRDRSAAESELNELRSRLSDIRADGVTSSQALLSRLERLETLLPFVADDISISQIVIASAESAGVTLERFQPAADPVVKKETTDKNSTDKDEKKPKDPSVVGGLKSYRYDFKVTGSYLAVANFLNSTVASRAVVVTFDGLFLHSGMKADNPTVFDEIVIAEGQLLIWTSLEKHLSAGSAKAGTTEGTPETQTSTPTSTTAPAAPGEETANPSQPTGTTPSSSLPPSSLVPPSSSVPSTTPGG